MATRQKTGKFIIAVAIIGAAAYFFFEMRKVGPSMGVEKCKEYVNSLINKGLYEKAAKVYEDLSGTPGLGAGKRANIAYLSGNVYMDELKDYQNALAMYVKAGVLGPGEGIKDELNRRTIECLERLGRTVDAQLELEKSTSIDEKQVRVPDSSAVVAKISERKITMNEILRRINDLPPAYQEMFKSKSSQLEFLQQYIAGELLYEKAKREGFERDKEIIERAFEAKKSFMVQKLIKEEVKDKIHISSKEIELYYENHKKDYVENKQQKTLSEVRDRVVAALETEKEKELYRDFITRAFGTGDVKIYDDVFKDKNEQGAEKE